MAEPHPKSLFDTFAVLSVGLRKVSYIAKHKINTAPRVATTRRAAPVWSGCPQTAHNGPQNAKGWASLTDETANPFTSFEAFCLARSPFGLGHCSADIDAVIAQRKDAAKRAQEAMPLRNVGRPKGEALNGVVNTIQRGSTNADYLTARIARDNPEILERMKAGEFKSVRAAALEAGIVQKRVSVPVDVDGAARALARP